MANYPRLLLAVAILVASTQSVFFKLSRNGEQRCFIIRSEFAKGSHVSFSYVVHSEVYGQNQMAFVLRRKDNDEILNEVQPDPDSFQRIFRFDNDGETVYRACFTNPNDYPKSVKFFVENKRKESVADKSRLVASKRLAGDLKNAVVGIESQMFTTYLNLKYTEESLAESQGYMKLAMVFKFSVMAFVAVLQSYSVAKLLSKLRVSFSDLI